MGVKGYFIQYKFIIPENIKHSSYTYQKLFRALYGYTQAVFKSNGKVYHYHRQGILSDIPYVRPGKNCVIIPPGGFQRLIDFFKTGRNPTHHWRGKGEWKAVYYMNEKDIDEKKAAVALVDLLNRIQVSEPPGKPLGLFEAVEIAASDKEKDAKSDFVALVLAQAKPVVDSTWFKAVYATAPELSKFYSSYKALRGL